MVSIKVLPESITDNLSLGEARAMAEGCDDGYFRAVGEHVLRNPQVGDTVFLLAAGMGEADVITVVGVTLHALSKRLDAILDGHGGGLSIHSDGTISSPAENDSVALNAVEIIRNYFDCPEAQAGDLWDWTYQSITTGQQNLIPGLVASALGTDALHVTRNPAFISRSSTEPVIKPRYDLSFFEDDRGIQDEFAAMTTCNLARYIMSSERNLTIEQFWFQDKLTAMARNNIAQAGPGRRG